MERAVLGPSCCPLALFPPRIITSAAASTAESMPIPTQPPVSRIGDGSVESQPLWGPCHGSEVRAQLWGPQRTSASLGTGMLGLASFLLFSWEELPAGAHADTDQTPSIAPNVLVFSLPLKCVLKGCFALKQKFPECLQ